ncbi:MAG: hypothetical protein ACFFG0_26930, partial [Candidatus Thorarchaeota archaeon]
MPVNNLTYPYLYPSEFVTLEFGPDEYFPSIKDPIGIDIQLPEIGQFRLNTTIWASDNPQSATEFPSYLYIRNNSDGNYYSFDYPHPAFSIDVNTNGDYLYIGSPTKWTGMTFDFSIPGVGGTIATPEIYEFTGPNWDPFPMENEGTSNLSADGTIEFDSSDPIFDSWDIGADVNIDPDLDESNYYWMRLECTSDYLTVPIIQQLTLLNNTMGGLVYFSLLGETGYEYADYWGTVDIYQPNTQSLEVNRDDDLGSSFNWDDGDSYIVSSLDPLIIGIEKRTYKLIILPEQWNYEGTVRIQFAIEDYWSYHHEETYDIATLSPTPNLHSIDIHNYTLSGYSNLTGSIYDYGLITQYNHTERALPFNNDESYFALYCHGKAYQWTQLIVTMQGVDNYELYLIQDLPWINNAPNAEVKQIVGGGFAINRTFEFGTFNEDFILLFEVEDSAENINFYIALSQYDTTPLINAKVKASYNPPIDLTLILAIIIPAAFGGGVVILYYLKKKGRILSKTPS